MRKYLRITLSLSLFALFISCSQNKNYKQANYFERNGETFIKLKGKRLLKGHNLVDVFSDKSYEDSLVLKVPSLLNGVIKGKDIPTLRGYYKYLGEIIIEGNKLHVKLSYNNTDESKIEPLIWNGEYDLVKD